MLKCKRQVRDVRISVPPSAQCPPLLPRATALRPLRWPLSASPIAVPVDGDSLMILSLAILRFSPRLDSDLVRSVAAFVAWSTVSPSPGWILRPHPWPRYFLPLGGIRLPFSVPGSCAASPSPQCHVCEFLCPRTPCRCILWLPPAGSGLLSLQSEASWVRSTFQRALEGVGPGS